MPPPGPYHPKRLARSDELPDPWAEPIDASALITSTADLRLTVAEHEAALHAQQRLHAIAGALPAAADELERIARGIEIDAEMLKAKARRLRETAAALRRRAT